MVVLRVGMFLLLGSVSTVRGNITASDCHFFTNSGLRDDPIPSLGSVRRIETTMMMLHHALLLLLYGTVCSVVVAAPAACRLPPALHIIKHAFSHYSYSSLLTVLPLRVVQLLYLRTARTVYSYLSIDTYILYIII